MNLTAKREYLDWAVRQAFTALAVGEHADVSISISKDRVSIEWYPPAGEESIVGTLEETDGEAVSSVLGAEARPLPAFVLDEQCYMKHGTNEIPVVVTGLVHYRDRPPEFLVKWSDYSGHQTRWCPEGELVKGKPPA